MAKDKFDSLTFDLIDAGFAADTAICAVAAAPGAKRGGAAQARSAVASYVPVTRKVTLTDEKSTDKSGVQS